MLVTKICKMCGNEFEGKTNAQYCSARCRMDYQTAYAKEWRDRNREHVKTYHRDYWRFTHPKKNTCD